MKFKIGDRVRYVGTYKKDIIGEIGVITRFWDENYVVPYPYYAEFPGYYKDVVLCSDSELEAVEPIDGNGQYLMEL